MKYDKPGHCVNCHKNLIFKQVVDEKVVKRFSPEKTEKCFIISDGSKMNVCICKTCKVLDGTEEYIMNSVIKGWDVETDGLVKNDSKPDWDKDKKTKYMNRMSKLKIISTAEGKDSHTIKQEIKRHREKTHGSNK